jgi:predicted amidohydrolase
MKKDPLRIATAQVRIAADVRTNGCEIRRLMRQARSGGALLAQFPEGALSGYTKSQIKDWGQVDWVALTDDSARQPRWPASWGSGSCSAAVTA